MKKLIIFLLLAQFHFSFSQWTPQNSGTSNFLSQVFFLNNDTGFAVQDNGILRRTLNGGVNWNLIYSGIHDVYQVSFTSFLNGNAIGYKELLNTNDGGLNWTPTYVDTTLYFNSIFFPTSNIGYATAWGDSVYVFKTTNGGNSWFVVHSFFSFGESYLNFLNSDTGFIAFEFSSQIAKTFDGGLTFLYDTLQSITGSFIGIHFTSSGTGYVTGLGGEIFKSNNFGNSWTNVSNAGNSLPLYSVFFTSPDTGFAVGGNGFSSGVILYTINGGISWTNTPGLIQTFNSVYFPSANIGYACGTNGTILKYDGLSGLEENNNIRSLFSTYPNPTIGSFIVQTKGEVKEISVFNSLGKEVYQKTNISALSTTIDLSANPKGIYLLKVTEGSRQAVKKIILM